MSDNKSSERDVVVAMSGGVDSCVAALILGKQYERVIGVSMQVWDYRKHGGCDSKATCCSPDDFTDARKVAAAIGIPYYVFDFEKEFRRDVIDNFVETYRRGQTPNPCVDCNSKVKFHQLRERARSLGFGHVATGHYAEIERRGAGYILKRPKDLEKDQTYFLYNLTQEELGETLFPLAPYTKAEVRELAKEAGLTVASKPESQDICFISGSVQDFLVRIGNQKRRGAIVDIHGNLLGEHDGIENFTVGQRKGLQLGGLETPLYVLELEAESNQVIVGPKEQLETEGFFAEQILWSHPELNSAGGGVSVGSSFDAMVQMRHRHQGVAVRVEVLEGQRCKVTFKNNWSTVSPGQAAVFYSLDNIEVYGGGRIGKPLRSQKNYEDKQLQSCYSASTTI